MKRYSVLILLVGVVCCNQLYAGFTLQEKILEELFEKKNYESLQKIVNTHLHGVRDALYKEENRWFSSGKGFDCSQQADVYHSLRAWLLKKTKENLCSWAFFNLFRDAMHSFAYPVKSLEAYSKSGLTSLFAWLITFNFLHIGLVKYYKSNEKLNNKWYTKGCPAALFKHCCQHRLGKYKKYIPNNVMPLFSDCQEEAKALLLLIKANTMLHDHMQLFFMCNDSWVSNWLSQRNADSNLSNCSSKLKAISFIDAIIGKGKNYFDVNKEIKPDWDYFWKLQEKDITL